MVWANSKSLIHRCIPLLLAAITTLMMANSHAQIYKWIDENGVTQYSDKKPPNQASEELEPQPNRAKNDPPNVKSIQPIDIEGQWLVNEGAFLPSSQDVTVIWEFKAGRWNVHKNGESIPSCDYQLIHNHIDCGEIEIIISKASRNQLLAELHGQEFVMRRK